jgi:hypothetical protein
MLRIVTVFALASYAGAAGAHHSQVGFFDGNARIEITGTVKSVSWLHPHGRIILYVADESGTVTEWHAETKSVADLRNYGVRPPAIDVGDRVTIAGAPSRRNRPEILTRSVLLPSGYELVLSDEPQFPAGKSGRIAGLRPRAVADPEVALAHADGLFRVWSTIIDDPSAFPLFKGGYPLTAAGEEGLAHWNPRDNPLLRCGTKGTPLVMISPLPMEFTRRGKDVVLSIEEYDVDRLIHMDPNAAAPLEHTLFGFSRGRWEGNALVVETDRIAAGYFDTRGAPQSDQIKVVERFSPNADYTRLDYRITVTDPVVFTAPFDLTRYFVWKPENTVQPWVCHDLDRDPPR